jgi:tetratricopeptide (TPR) repeat protein
MSRSHRMTFAFLLVGFLGWSQTGNSEAELQAGLRAFQQQQYQQALQSFRRIIDEQAPQAPDAEYWSAMAYMALDMLEDADRTLEHYLARYPSHALAVEAHYQKSRLLFLERDYENALQASYEFIRSNPGSPLVANAYFWIGESLYSLGKLEEAERVFAKVVREYPQSYKVEAAGYRLSLLEFKKREEELLRLLKWSHEEFLRAVDEYKRREKSYEQALAAYQQRVGSPEQRQAEAQALEELRAENASLSGKLQLLEAQAASQTQQAEQKAGELAELEKTLALKAQALALKESLLLRYERAEGQN